MPARSAAGVQREDFRAFEQLRHVVAQQPRGEPFGERGLADAGVADEDRIVLAAAAEDFERAFELVAAADQRIELARLGPGGQAGGVRGQRIARGRRFRPRAKPASASPAAASSSPAGATGGTLLMPWVMYSSTSSRVTPCAARSCAAYDLFCCERRRQHVARLHFLPAGALDVQHGGLQHAAERERLFRLLLLTPAELLDRLLQVLVEILAELRQVGAAGGQNPLAVRIVGERVEQVLEREVGMPPRGRLSVGNGQDDFESWTEHVDIPGLIAYSGSIAARSGNPLSRARSVTVATFVSATSNGYTPQSPLPCVCTIIMMRCASAGCLWKIDLEDLDDEVHRRVVVVQQQDLEELRFLRFLPGALENLARCLAIGVCHVLIDCSWLRGLKPGLRDLQPQLRLTVGEALAALDMSR